MTSTSSPTAPTNPPGAPTTWQDFAAQAPDLAAFAEARLEAHGLAFLATVRADGSPRISGLEPLVTDGQLWLGMMPGARKVADLERDPRFALHNASADKAVTDGDVKISGRAVPVAEGSPDMVAFPAAFAAANGYEPPPGPINLFVADLTEVSSIRPAGDHLLIEWWHPGDGPHTTKRY